MLSELFRGVFGWVTNCPILHELHAWIHPYLSMNDKDYMSTAFLLIDYFPILHPKDEQPFSLTKNYGTPDYPFSLPPSAFNNVEWLLFLAGPLSNPCSHGLEPRPMVQLSLPQKWEGFMQAMQCAKPVWWGHTVGSRGWTRLGPDWDRTEKKWYKS